MGRSNKDLHAAKKGKKDEFYTQRYTIEQELKHYTDHFYHKTVLLNCNDSENSEFWKFFVLKLHSLHLTKVVAVAYNPSGSSYKLEATLEDSDKPVMVDLEGVIHNVHITKTPLQGNGDFRSAESTELLKQADIVVTNPPFSLFREYVAQLIEYNKKFLILGNINAVTYKEIFPLIKDNKIWLGMNNYRGTPEFRVPDDYPMHASSWREDEEGRYIKVKGVRWYTNLEIPKRYEKIELAARYYGFEEQYPKYDNYDAIEVSKVAEIPMDYEGVMGVPITFLDKYSPEQFELVGMAEDNGKGYSGGIWDGRNPHCVVNGRNKFKRLFIRNKHPQRGGIV